MQSELSDEQVDNSQSVEPREEFSALMLLIVLFQRKRMIALLTLGTAIITAVIVFLVPNQYTATTVVLPPAQNSSISSALLSQFNGASALASAAGAGLGIKNPGDMYVSFFRGRTIEDTLIQRFGLMSRYHEKRMTDARDAFEEHTSVILGVKDNLIRITVRDRDPNLAAQIANSYVDEFRKYSSTMAITEASQRRVFFQQQLLEANGNLTAAEEALKHTEQTTGILQIDSQARSLIESAAAIRAQVTAKEVQLQSLRAFATDDNPNIVLAKDQLAALQAQLARLTGSSANSGSDIIVPKGDIPEAGTEYVRKLREVKYYEAVDELIARQFELAKLDEAREGAIIQVAEVAVPPDKKSSPHRTLIIILMTLIAFMVSVLWILAADRWHKLLRDPERLQRVQTIRDLLFTRHKAQHLA